MGMYRTENKVETIFFNKLIDYETGDCVEIGALCHNKDYNSYYWPPDKREETGSKVDIKKVEEFDGFVEEIGRVPCKLTWWEADNIRRIILKEKFDTTFELLNLKHEERKSDYFYMYCKYQKHIDIDINSLLINLDQFDELHQSPYSDSFYNSEDIDWGYKPEGSLRLSNHWNFRTGISDYNCPIEGIDRTVYNTWLLCKYSNGKYHILENFGGEDEFLKENYEYNQTSRKEEDYMDGE